jgi:GTPase SAR1 family protein
MEHDVDRNGKEQEKKLEAAEGHSNLEGMEVDKNEGESGDGKGEEKKQETEQNAAVISDFKEVKSDEKGKEQEDLSDLVEMPLDENDDEKGKEQATSPPPAKKSSLPFPFSFFSNLFGNDEKVKIQPKLHDIKLMVVGDEMGRLKTKLLGKYIEMFPQESIGEGSYGHNVRLNIVPEKTVVMHLWNTEGMEDTDYTRRASYDNTGVAILLYSVTNKESYENIGRWVEEIKSLCRDAQYILVGCDNDDPARSVTYEEGAQLAKEIGAAAFFECSVATGAGVKEIFDEAAWAAQIPKTQMNALIQELKTYADNRAAKGYGQWDEAFGGKPGKVKVDAALGLVAKLTGADPKRKFSEKEIEALKTDTLGERVMRHRSIVYRLENEWRALPVVAEDAGNIQSSSSSYSSLSRRPSQ